MKYRTKARIVIVLAIVAFAVLAAVCNAAERPAPLDPNRVPFPYEPNLCPSPVLDYVISEPNLSVVYAIGAHNRWGLDIELDVVDANGELIDVVVQKLGRAKDPNGGWNQYWQFAWTPPAIEKVHYLELICTDKVGRQDRCTLLVYAVYDDAPFIFHGSPPIARLTQAQRLWQYAKKVQQPLTLPTRVWR